MHEACSDVRPNQLISTISGESLSHHHLSVNEGGDFTCKNGIFVLSQMLNYSFNESSTRGDGSCPSDDCKACEAKNQSEWRGDGTTGARRHKITRKDKEAVSSIMCSTDAVLFVP